MGTYSISTEILEKVPILTFEGDMTSDSDGDVMKIYHDIKERHNPKNIIINFKKTRYINSAGICSLLNIIQDLQGEDGKICFVGLTDHFYKIMDIVGILDFVTIYNTNTEAVNKINKD